MSFDLSFVQRQFVQMRPAGGFPVLLADPNCNYETYSEKGQGKSPSRHYECASVEEIAALPVSLLAAEHCALFLWCTWPLQERWHEIYKGWGFRYAGLAWEWIKFNPKTGAYAFGPGHGTRKNLEPCLLCVKGEPSLRKPLEFFGVKDARGSSHAVRDFIEAMPLDALRGRRREHSRKPDEQYARIEQMFDGPYAELFSRTQRNGWTSWGDQAGTFIAEEAA